MTSVRRRYVASTSLRRHVPTGNLAPLGPPNILNLGPPNILNLGPPQYSKPWPPNILNLGPPQYSKPWPPQYSKLWPPQYSKPCPPPPPPQYSKPSYTYVNDQWTKSNGPICINKCMQLTFPRCSCVASLKTRNAGMNQNFLCSVNHEI